MSTMRTMVTIFSLVAGMVCKLYDDLNDNPLFAKWKNPYVNEYLKGVLCVMLIVISESSLYLLIMILLVNGLQMHYDSEAFSPHPYEFSGMLVLATYFVYKVFTMPTTESFDVKYAVLCILVLGTIIANGGTNGFKLFIGYKEAEFSVTKLIVRGIVLVGLVAALLLNTVLHIVSPSITSVLYFFMGYLAVSCIVQCVSLCISLWNEPMSASERNEDSVIAEELGTQGIEVERVK